MKPKEVVKRTGIDNSYIYKLKRVIDMDTSISPDMLVLAIRQGHDAETLVEWSKVTAELRALGFRTARKGEQVEWLFWSQVCGHEHREETNEEHAH